MDLVFFTPVRGNLSGDIFGLKKFLKKKKIFQLKKNFDENFFGLGQFLKKFFFFGIQNFNISPYTIFADANPRTPDMQAKTGQPIHFWNCLLKVVVLQKTESS